MSLFVATAVIAVAALTSGTAAVASSSKVPAGYTVVSTPVVPAPAGQQTLATATCPGTTRPVGGGVYTDSADLEVTVHSSYPGKNTWTGVLNNFSAADTDLVVYAVCVKRPSARFAVVTSGFTIGRNGQYVHDAFCPSGVVVGGGVRMFSTSPSVTISSMYPASSSEWEVRMNDTSVGGNIKAREYAICENVQPAGYSIQTATAVDNPVGSDSFDSVGCPAASVPLDGGVVNSSNVVGVNLNTSVPLGSTWYNYVNNASAVDNTVSSVTICAGA